MDDLTARAQAALEASRGDEARDLIDRALQANPADANVRELYVALHLARAIRLSAAARERRRDDIVQRKIPYDTEFQDRPEVAQAFDKAEAALEEVLRVAPDHEKTLMAKASLVFRRDREKGRPAAMEILQKIADANPSNRQVLYSIRRIERPCPRCSDSGFCPRCRGRGSRRILRMESKCEACHGQGICLACGIL